MVCILNVICLQINAQLVTEELVCAEKSRLGSLLSFRTNHQIVHGYDIHYHRCYWRVNPKRNGYLTGKVFSLFTVTKNTDSIGFDLRAQMQVDSVKHHGVKIPFKRKSDILYCYNPAGWLGGTTDSLTVYYQGNPQMGSGFGYYVWDHHQTGPVIHTLSEPYGAAYWWPCKQTLSDKIDSIDLYISTVPDFKAASNGLLISSDSINDSTRVFHWKHRYPIATYLVAFATSNYKEFTNYASFYNRTDSVAVLNYVFPQSYNEAQSDLPALLPVFRLFDSLFGEYPFIKEKYGHAQFTWGGGMEHQTMSFMVNFSFDLQAHELAHQWFGNKVTCGTWSDLWLNEGFATYANALCYRYLRPLEWTERMAGVRNAATAQDNGSIYVADTNTINRLFSGALTYSKGAFVLHMLRIKIGDQAFFNGLKKYLNQSQTAYGFAITKDLQKVLETESGQNLDTFFMRWYKGEGFPYLKINWQQKGPEMEVRIEQTPSHVSVPFFELTIPIRFRNSQRDSIVSFRPVTRDQTFRFLLPFSADSAEFDPEVTVLARASLGGINLDQVRTDKFIVSPNPGSGMYLIKSLNHVATKAEVYNLAGQKVFETPKDFIHTPGENITLNLSDLGNGTYVTRIYTNNSVTSLKIIKLN